MPDSATCRQCGAPMKSTTRFCGRCGRANPSEAQSHQAELRRDLRESGRVAYSIATVFVGALISVAVGWFIDQGEMTLASLVAVVAVQLSAGLVAVRFLEPGALLKTVPLRTRARWIFAAFPVGALMCLVALGYVMLILSAFGAEWPDAGSGEGFGRLEALFAVVAAPLLEEWLCRGVLWTAATRVTTPRRTIVLTSMLFAVMHGLQGVLFLAFPHRFLGGLSLGWLRMKSGSLVPCVLAHATWNLIAVIVG